MKCSYCGYEHTLTHDVVCPVKKSGLPITTERRPLILVEDEFPNLPPEIQTKKAGAMFEYNLTPQDDSVGNDRLKNIVDRRFR